nr:exodeoxyribonuclease VII large subunit [uncultured Intestinimonas sp.]
MLLDYQGQRLSHGLTAALGRDRARFAGLAAKLDALSPLKVLGRGYALVRSSGGEVISSAEQTEEGEQISVRLADGALDCRVEKKRRL